MTMKPEYPEHVELDEQQTTLFDVRDHLKVPIIEGLPFDWTVTLGLTNLDAALHRTDPTQRAIAIWGLLLTDLLLHKNRGYGNSATEPIEIFAKGISPQDRMGVRMDDKISRIVRGNPDHDGENPEVDLAGYLLLRQVERWLTK